MRECLVIGTDDSINLFTAHNPADFAQGVVGKFDIGTCPDGKHVLAVGETSRFDNEPINPTAWLAYGRSMLHGTAVLWHDTDDRIDPDLIAMLQRGSTTVRAACDLGPMADRAVDNAFRICALPYWDRVRR